MKKLIFLTLLSGKLIKVEISHFEMTINNLGLCVGLIGFAANQPHPLK